MFVPYETIPRQFSDIWYRLRFLELPISRTIFCFPLRFENRDSTVFVLQTGKKSLKTKSPFQCTWLTRVPLSCWFRFSDCGRLRTHSIYQEREHWYFSNNPWPAKRLHCLQLLGGVSGIAGSSPSQLFVSCCSCCLCVKLCFVFKPKCAILGDTGADSSVACVAGACVI